MATIGVIVGSTRTSRIGDRVATWVVTECQSAHPQHTFQLIDLCDYPLSMFNSTVSPMAANKVYEDPAVQAFSDCVDVCEGFLFVTPEYNHSIPAVLKNAIDHLGPEWSTKPAGFIGYGFTRAIRAVSHLREILLNFSMLQDRNQVGIDLSLCLQGGDVHPSAANLAELHRVAQFVVSSADAR